MLDKTIEINNLIDMYGSFLTDKQLRIMIDYFKNDYSLSEIADNLNISKQAVKYSIDLSMDRLTELDNNLHLTIIKNKLNEFLPSLDENQKIKLQEIIDMLGD